MVKGLRTKIGDLDEQAKARVGAAMVAADDAYRAADGAAWRSSMS